MDEGKAVNVSYLDFSIFDTLTRWLDRDLMSGPQDGYRTNYTLLLKVGQWFEVKLAVGHKWGFSGTGAIQ